MIAELKRRRPDSYSSIVMLWTGLSEASAYLSTIIETGNVKSAEMNHIEAYKGKTAHLYKSRKQRL